MEKTLAAYDEGYIVMARLSERPFSMVVKRLGSGITKTRILTLFLPVSACVTLCKLFNLSRPQFPHLGYFVRIK